MDPKFRGAVTAMVAGLAGWFALVVWFKTSGSLSTWPLWAVTGLFATSGGLVVFSGYR